MKFVTNSLKVFSVAAFLMGTTNLFATDAKFRIDSKILSYTSETNKKEVNSTSTTEKTTTLDTNVTDSTTITIAVDQCRLAFNPHGGPIALSHFMDKSLELGLKLDFNSKKVDKPKDESSDRTIGVFGRYYMSLGKPEMEFTLGLEMGNSTSESTTGTTTTKTNNSTTTIPLEFAYYLPMTENFFYGFGLNYTISNGKDSESDVKTSVNTLGIDLVNLRYKF